MRRFKIVATAAILLLFGAAGCEDLEVTNPNDPEREQALSNPGDVEALIAGSYNTWYNGMYYMQQYWVSNASFQSAGTVANFGNYDMTLLPRPEVINDPAYSDYHYTVERSWQRSYRALAAVADGLRALDDNPAIGEALDDNDEGGEERARALARFVQGLAHASIAVTYDQGFIIDETVQVTDETGAVPQTEIPYDEVMEAAYGYFDDAITLASGGDWTIPSSWMSVPVTADELVEIIHSWRAIFRASLPRTPDEAVDWDAVLDDLDAGLDETWFMEADYTTDNWYNGSFDYSGGANGWGTDTYFVIGMADQSGNYQDWLDMPIGSRTAWFGDNQDDDPVLIITPDERFPQGSTLAEQEENPGEYWVIPRSETTFYDVSEHFTNPSRGTWRWSYYYNPQAMGYWFQIGPFEVPTISLEEVNLLRAEALLETGDEDGAATLINLTREEFGLSSADPDAANDGNTSCVPKLPNGECGDIWEMLKWEKRVETRGIGLFGVSWYWDGRRWGDLYRGTPLQLPIPAGELETLEMPFYTLGGVNDTEPNASSGSSYNYPDEN